MMAHAPIGGGNTASVTSFGASLEDDPAAHGLMRHLTRKWRKSPKVLAGTTPRFGVQGALQIGGCVERHLREEGGAVRAHRERIVPDDGLVQREGTNAGKLFEDRSVARRIILDKSRLDRRQNRDTAQNKKSSPEHSLT